MNIFQRTFSKEISWKARIQQTDKFHPQIRAGKRLFYCTIRGTTHQGHLRGLFSVLQIMENQNSKDSILSWSLWLLMKECMDNLIQKALITLTDLNCHASEWNWNETFFCDKNESFTKRRLAVAFSLWCESNMNAQGPLTGWSQCSRSASGDGDNLGDGRKPWGKENTSVTGSSRHSPRSPRAEARLQTSDWVSDYWTWEDAECMNE